jgi:O-antigen biosynthesis protein
MTASTAKAPAAAPRARTASLAAPVALQNAVWLADHVLVLVVSVDRNGERPVELSATAGRRSLAVESASVVYQRARRLGKNESAEALVVIAAQERTSMRADRVNLKIHHGSLARTLRRRELASAATDVRTLARSRLAALDPVTRARLLEALTATCAGALSRDGRMSLARKLFQLREALRERRPYAVLSRDEPQGLQVETIAAVDERSFWVKGWARDADAPLASLTLISPEGARVDVLPSAFRFRRRDVEEFYVGWSDQNAKSGFIAFVELPTPSLLDPGWVAEIENALGAGVEVQMPPVIRDPITTRDTILSELAGNAALASELTPDHAFPALTRLQAQLGRDVEVESVVQHGTPPSEPATTIVIPLYGRVDLLEHQLSQFVHDPELREADLVYVLDSPELGPELAELAAQLHALYRLPFRVVSLTRNGGFSAVNNIGASFARSRRLLLLNSDVLPVRPGWLGTMLAFYDRTPRIGALGAKLLYEDGSLQHAGMYFDRSPGTGLWENAHFFKGLHRDLPAASVARPVPAVTAACMMIDRGLYEELGGLRGMYVQGDYEDSDLCLRLLECGRENWYLPDAELFHLEAQSYPSELRRLTRRYNTWLHTHLWGTRIERLIRGHFIDAAV